MRRGFQATFAGCWFLIENAARFQREGKYAALRKMEKFRIQRALCRRSVSSSVVRFTFGENANTTATARKSLRFLINRRRVPSSRVPFLFPPVSQWY